MCELFCLSSLRSTTVSFSLERLASHGALGQSAVDGWGLAYFDGRDVRLYKEPEPAGESRWLAFIRERRLECTEVISHIRRATRGALTHANTQPFARELAGRMHVFAHNGVLTGIDRSFAETPRRFMPVGQTDSELGFCILIDRIASLWEAGPKPSIGARLAVVSQFAADMRELGSANFLYADGEVIFAHSHRRHTPGDPSYAPGLWRLERGCEVDAEELGGKGVEIGGADGPQQAILLASVPLTTEPWTPLAVGEIVVLHNGRVAPRLGRAASV